MGHIDLMQNTLLLLGLENSDSCLDVVGCGWLGLVLEKRRFLGPPKQNKTHGKKMYFEVDP